MAITFFNAISNSNKQDKAHAENLAVANAVKAIYTAIFAHENWKYRLQTFVEGTSKEVFTAGQAYRADESDLGKWIQTTGKAKFAKCIAFSRLVEYQKMFHYAAANVVSLVQAGKTQEAKVMMDVQFEDFSDAIISCLLKLREVTENADVVFSPKTGQTTFYYAKAA